MITIVTEKTLTGSDLAKAFSESKDQAGKLYFLQEFFCGLSQEDYQIVLDFCRDNQGKKKFLITSEDCERQRKVRLADGRIGVLWEYIYDRPERYRVLYFVDGSWQTVATDGTYAQNAPIHPLSIVAFADEHAEIAPMPVMKTDYCQLYGTSQSLLGAYNASQSS